MAITFKDHNGDGNSTKDFPFPSIKVADVKVDVDGILYENRDITGASSGATTFRITDYTTNGGGNVVFDTAPTSGSIRIFRDTDVDSAKATYTAGSSVKAADLNANHEQLLFAAQEEQNQTVLTSDIKDGAVTTAKIADLNVTTAKVANRAITKDKIAVNTITADEIDDNAVGGGELKDGAVDTQHVQTDAITKVKIGEARLKTLADMQSGTASKLASSTALTADIADLNQIDGMQKATSITNDDTKFPTSGAVIDYVTAQIDALDAFKILANEVSFPNTQFDSGVVVSIGDAGGIVINGSGTSTTARTLNGTTVTINNFPTSLNNETLVSGVGLLVSSTGSGQIYNYHKLLATENDVKRLSDDINDFNERYRIGTSAPTTNNDAGDLFFNTTSKVFQVYNGTDWEEVKNTGNFFISTLTPAFNGSVQDFTITNPPSYAQQILLSINGVIQKPNSGTSTPSEGFALSGSTVKLAAAPAAGSTYHAVVMGEAVNIGSPSDNTVTTASLQNSAVTTDKIANDAVTPVKMSTMTSEGKLRLNPSDNSTTWQRENKHMHQIRDDVYVESTINVGDKAGFDFTPLAISAFSYSGTTLTLTTATHAIAVGDNILIKDSASGFQEAFNTISGTTGTTVKVTRSSDPSSSLSTANTKVIVYTPADPRGCINVAKDHDKFDQNTFNPILRGYVGKDLDTATGTNTEAFKIELKKDSSATDHVATLLHSTREFGSGQRLALTIDDGNSYPDGKNLVLTQNGVKITADDSAFTDSDELLEVEGNAKIDGDLTTTGRLTISDTSPIINFTDTNNDSDFRIQVESGSFIIEDATNSYADRFLIDSSGNVQIPQDSARLRIGASQDLDIFHHGGNSLIANNTGTLLIHSDNLDLRPNTNSGEVYLRCTQNGAVELRYDNVKKFETTSDGVDITGTLKVNGSTISTGGLGNVVEDTTPQLGGDLQSNGNDIDFADNDKAVFGTGGDLSIYHDGNNNYIDGNSAAEDHLYIRANVGSDHSSNIHLQAKSGEDSIVCRDDEQVELYYNGSLKFQTQSSGAKVTGTLVTTSDVTIEGGNDINIEDNGKAKFGNSNDLQIYHTGSANHIDGTAPTAIRSDVFQVSTLDGGHKYIDIPTDEQGVELYYDNSKKFETTSGGATVSGNVFVTGSFRGDDNSKLDLGSSNDLLIYHDGTNSLITNATGVFVNKGDDYRIKSYSTDEDMIRATVNDAVELYHNGTKRLETTSTGITVTSNIACDSIDLTGNLKVTDSNKLKIGTSNDLEIYHDGGSGNYIDSVNKDLYLRCNVNSDLGGDIVLQAKSGENSAIFRDDEGVELYYDNNKKIETASHGSLVSADNDIRFTNGNWTGESCKIQHHGNSLYLQGGSSSNTIILRSSDGNDRWRMQTNGDLIPGNDNGTDIGSHNSRVEEIYVGGGVYLGGTASKHKLDHYEEGAWNPQLYGGSYQASGYSIQDGHYVRVGALVNIFFAIAITGKGSMSGDLRVINLPFGVHSEITGTSIEAAGIAAYWSNVDPNSSHITLAGDSDNSIYLRHTVGAEDNPDQMQASDIDSDFTIRGSISYHTAD